MQAGTKRVYRVPSLLATSFDREVASRFLRMHVPADMPKVVWKIMLDPAHGCCHVRRGAEDIPVPRRLTNAAGLAPWML